MSKKVSIAILDSGVNTKHEKFTNRVIKGKTLQIDSAKKVNVIDEFEDEIGHGTAIYDIISSVAMNAEITNYKILSDRLTVKIEDFIEILRFFITCHYDIINISISINEYNEDMKKVCDTLTEKGTIIVSSFDNLGAASYPAAFDSVIGVDVSEDAIRVEKYEFVEGSIVNLRGRGGPFRIAWKNPPYILVKGSSYTCAYMSAYISNAMGENRNEISKIMKERSYKQYKYAVKNVQIPTHRINDAILFPFNKEMHALARFSNYLDFNIKGICDYRYSGLIGASVNSLLGITNTRFIIEDIQKVDFGTVDTLILGHMAKYLKAVDKSILESIVRRAIENELFIYSFDNLDSLEIEYSKNYKRIYTPEIQKENLIHNFGKLYEYSKPILCVVGTSSKQGKFTLQLEIRYRLMEYGYKVGQIGTEPSALLFGMDYVFPSGYRASIPYDDWEILIYINNLINSLCIEQKDIIITGLQSGILPYNKNNANFYPFLQQSFLQAVAPDAIVLCINPDDDVSYIDECIKYCESVTNSKVIAIVCFPMELKKNWKGLLGHLETMEKMHFETIKDVMKKKYNLPTYLLGCDVEMDILVDDIIRFFAE